MRASACERKTVSICTSACVRERKREREREIVRVCCWRLRSHAFGEEFPLRRFNYCSSPFAIERASACKCVCVCVCVREREREMGVDNTLHALLRYQLYSNLP